MPEPQDPSRGPQGVQITDVQLRGMICASCLTPIQRGTLLMMADGLYRDDLRFRIGFQRLADLLGLGRRATIERVKSLEKTGVIHKIRGGGGRNEAGKGITNIWVLDLEALRQQALAREPESENIETERHPPNGAADCTGNGAGNQHQGCSPATPTVQPTAHDPTSPTPPIEETKKEHSVCAADDEVQIHRRRVCPTNVLPWVSRYDGPKGTRANRLKQLRAQAQHVEKSARNHPQNTVEFSKEGTPDGIAKQ